MPVESNIFLLHGVGMKCMYIYYATWGVKYSMVGNENIIYSSNIRNEQHPYDELLICGSTQYDFFTGPKKEIKEAVDGKVPIIDWKYHTQSSQAWLD